MCLNVLVLTSIYPWHSNPQDAVFVRSQISRLQSEGLQCQVVAFRYCPRGIPPAVWRMCHLHHLESMDENGGFPVHNVFIPRRLTSSGDIIPRVGSTLIDYISRSSSLMKTDVIYAHWLWPSGAAALHLRDQFGWPVVAIARGSDMHHWQNIHPFCRAYVEKVIQSADRVLANCAGLRDRATAMVPLLHRPIDVIYNGCDAERFRPGDSDRVTLKRQLRLDSDRKTMLFCGSVIERKGIRNLVKAWDRFSAGNDKWELAVVGRLVERPLVRLLRALDRTRIVGPVNQTGVLAYMQAADAYVQPSIHEGLANATMEAMATELPVIATNTGGQRELITNGVNGLLIPVEDSTALYEALTLISSNPDTAVEMGRRARDTIINNFAPGYHIAALKALLTQTATQRRPSAEATQAGAA